MANFTPNLNLEKPLQTEGYDVDVFNANADKIDTFAGQIPARALTADKLTTGAKINGVNFKGDTDITLPVATTSVAGTVIPDGESISIDSNGRITAALPEAHALKGYLESGQSYTDTTLYSDVYGYNHSTFDVSKFTKVGSPIITDDGIASGFSKSNYLTIPIFDLSNFTFSMSFDITSLDTTTVLVEDNSIWSIPTSQTYRSRLSLYSTKRLGIGLLLEDNTNDVTTLQTEPLTALGRYKTMFMFNGTKYTFIVVYPDGSIVTKELSSTSKLSSDGNPIFIGTNSTSYERSFFAGNIDLKSIEVKNYNIPVFSGNKTGIDTIKPADYTVVGTPTISSDGIASGFNTSNYISIDTSNIDLSTANTWEIDFAVKLNNSTSTTEMYFDTYDVGINSIIRFDYYNPNNENAFRLMINSTDNTRIFNYVTIKNNIVINTWYNLKLIYTGTHYIIKDADGNILQDVESDKKVNLTSRIWVGKRQANDQPLTNGSIDLNSFKIYVNGDLVYQPCLLIPYNESSTGSKIVDVAYRDRVIDVYNQYGSANYYTIDEVNQNATLPMGEIYGFMPSITYW